jgi:hypothetical protein
VKPRFAVRALLAVLPALLAGCPSPPKPPSTPSETATTREDDATRLARLYAELQDDILTSYERDEPPDQDSAMIDPKVGAARIGAGPGDVYIAAELRRAPSRWPLDVDHATRTEVRSKNLAIHIAADQSAAWMADELSWRIEVCGRTAVIPLRVTALYAHEGDRWISVFEHLSYGQAGPASLDNVAPKPIATEVASSELEAALQDIVERSLLRTPRDPQALAQDATSLVLGPGAADEWAARQVLGARVPAGELEQHRVAAVGRRGQEPTIAYWVGNYLADVPGRGAVGMRATFVFEKRPAPSRDSKKLETRVCRTDPASCRWTLVQSQLSQPISDDQLTSAVFGTALLSPKPLMLDCSDGSPLIAPAVVPGRAPRPPPAAPAPPQNR